MAGRRQRTVLLVDEIANHEGVMSNLRSSGRQFQTVRLAELPSWRDITDVFEDYEVTAVIVKFSVTALIRIGSDGYLPQFDDLINRIAPVPHVVFMSESIYTGEAIRRADADSSLVYDRDSNLRVQEVMVGNTIITRGDINTLRTGVQRVKASPLRVIASRSDAEITVAAEQFVHEAEKGLLFRAYVPAGRIWEAEFDRMLTLFKDFLVRVANADVRLEQNRTPYGVSYAFYGDGVTPQQVASNFEDFTSLLNVAVTDPSAAEAILSERYELAVREITAIITRYAKEARRLQVDIRHDRERKLLSIRQQFESELYDTAPGLDMRQVERIIDASFPKSLELVPSGRTPVTFNLFDKSQISFEFNSQHVERLEGIIAKEVHGNIELNADEQKFIDLISHRGGSEARDLTTALYQLRDPGTTDPERVSAGQRLRTFLLRIAGELEAGAFKVLQTYIEKKLGL